MKMNLIIRNGGLTGAATIMTGVIGYYGDKPGSMLMIGFLSIIFAVLVAAGNDKDLNN